MRNNLLIDMSDSIRYALRNNSPSGIQRIVFSLTNISELVQPIIINWKNNFVYIPLDRNILTWNFIKALSDTKDSSDYDDFLNKYDCQFTKIKVDNIDNKSILFIGGPWNYNNSTFIINKLSKKNNIGIYIHDLIPFQDYKSSKYSSGFIHFFKEIVKYNIQLFTSTKHNQSDINKFLQKDIVTIVPFALNSNLFNTSYGKNDGLINLENDFFYVSIGSIDTRKRHDLIIDQWIEKELYKDFKLFIIGNQIIEDERFNNSLQRATVITDNIDYLGIVDDIMYSRLLSACQGIFYPSNIEGFGLVLIDAYIYSKPCFIPINTTYKDAHCSYVEIDYNNIDRQDIVSPKHIFDPIWSNYYHSNWFGFIKEINLNLKKEKVK
jgi:hypothetical protein